MKKKLCTIAAAAAFFMLPFFGVTAYAQPVVPPETAEVITEVPPEAVEVIIDTIIEELPVLPESFTPIEVTIPTEAEDIPVTDFEVEPPRPFTPSGTATVVDNATDGDGKEFYTIMTPDEHVFYLVIDKQRSSENVYFLNAVTMQDLIALAEMPEENPIPAPIATQMPEIEMETGQKQATDPTPDENGGGNMGMVFVVIAIVLIGGGAGWYFKVYKPKQQRGGMEEDYAADDPGLYGGDDSDLYGQDGEQDGGAPPWYGDGETPGDGGGDGEE